MKGPPNPKNDPRSAIDEEIEFHFHQCIEDLIAAGFTPAAASREARARFGDVDRYRKELRRIWRFEIMRREHFGWLESISNDLRHTLRGLGRAPGFALAVILTLGLGIGVNTTMYSILDRVLLSPPEHVTNPNRIKRIYVKRSFVNRQFTTGSLAFLDIKDFDSVQAFQSVGIYGYQDLTMGYGESARRVRATYASASFFTTLGVKPEIGRFFNREEDVVGATPVAVLAYDLWNSKFDKDRNVIGKTLALGEKTFTIIGVAPSGFMGVDLNPVDLFLPAHSDEGVNRWGTSRHYYWLRAVVRLRPDVGIQRAEAEATSVHRAARAQDPRYDQQASVVLASLIRAKGPQRNAAIDVAVWLTGVSVIVLLIVCANVSNLLLARAAARRKETAVRVALGVSRSRLIFHNVVESLVLAISGGIAALVLAHWGRAIIASMLLDGLTFSDGVVSGKILGFTALASILAGLLSGFMPAMQIRSRGIGMMLRSAGRGSSESASLTRKALLAAQSAMSVLLLVGAVLFIRSLNNVNNLDLGFESDGLTAMFLEGKPGIADERLVEVYDSSRAALSRLPAIESATFSVGMPFRSSWSTRLRVPGKDSLPTLPSGGPYYDAVGDDYFSTMKLRLVRGRGLEPSDNATGAAPVTVINETMADLIWPGQEPIGSCMMIGGGEAPRCYQIVGIAKNTRRATLVDEDKRMVYYVSYKAFSDNIPEALLVRFKDDRSESLQATTKQLMAVFPDLRFINVHSFSDFIDPQRASWKLGATLFSLFGLLALVVAAIGLYSVLAFDVARRRYELGIRAALGATARSLVRTVYEDATRVIGIGIAVGIVTALIISSRIDHLLFQESPWDPLVFGAVVITLMVVAAVASLIPAIRATRVDPNDVLKSE